MSNYTVRTLLRRYEQVKENNPEMDSAQAMIQACDELIEEIDQALSVECSVCNFKEGYDCRELTEGGATGETRTPHLERLYRAKHREVEE